MDWIELITALIASGALGGIAHWAITFTDRQVAIQVKTIVMIEQEMKCSPACMAHPEMSTAVAKLLDDYKIAVADGKLTAKELLDLGADIMAAYKTMKGS